MLQSDNIPQTYPKHYNRLFVHRKWIAYLIMNEYTFVVASSSGWSMELLTCSIGYLCVEACPLWPWTYCDDWCSQLPWLRRPSWRFGYSAIKTWKAGQTEDYPVRERSVPSLHTENLPSVMLDLIGLPGPKLKCVSGSDLMSCKIAVYRFFIASS